MVLLLPLSLFTVTILPSKAPPASALLARAHLPTPHSRTAADSNVLAAPTMDVFVVVWSHKMKLELTILIMMIDQWCVYVLIKKKKKTKRKRLCWVTKMVTYSETTSFKLHWRALHFRGANADQNLCAVKFDHQSLRIPRKTKEQQALMCCVQTWRKLRIASKPCFLAFETHLDWRCLHPSYYQTNSQSVCLGVKTFYTCRSYPYQQMFIDLCWKFS